LIIDEIKYCVRLIEQNNYSTSINHFENIIKTIPNILKNINWKTIYENGIQLLTSNQYNSALNLFKKAIEFDHSNTNVDLNNGIDLLKSKKFIECLEYFEKVLVVEPNNLEAYYNKVIKYCI